ncbi:hypothetical protein N9478_04240 [Gammaproteobacteria bacterium]|nr:hypothetical protein [Gammaproteobacteria bacterium]
MSNLLTKLALYSFFLSSSFFIQDRNLYANEIFGLWERDGGEATYTFRPIGGNGIALVIVLGKYQDIYTGTINDSQINVCAVESEPFSACIIGVVNSDTSMSVVLDNCVNKLPDVEICGYFAKTGELKRNIYFDINGIFSVPDGKFFMIESSGGLITAHELNLENGEVDGYSGTRSGNTGSVTPFDDSGPYLDFEIKSATELTATVTKCNNCAADDAAETPPGTVVPITRVTN